LAKRGIEDCLVSEFVHDLTLIEVVEDMCGVVEHHVYDYIDPAGMGLFDQLGQLALGCCPSSIRCEALVHIEEVLRPIAMVVVFPGLWSRVLQHW